MRTCAALPLIAIYILGASPCLALDFMGLPVSPLGNAQLSEQGGNLVVSNIGSSGLDGVSVDVGEAAVWHSAWLPLDSGGTLPAGASFEFRMFGRLDGIDDQFLWSADMVKTPSGDIEIIPDASGVGAPTALVEVYNGETLVVSLSGATGPFTSETFPSAHTDPKGRTIGVLDGEGRATVGLTIPMGGMGAVAFWGAPEMIQIPGLGPVLGDQLRMTFEGTTAQVDSFNRVEILAKDIPTLSFSTLLALDSRPIPALGPIGLASLAALLGLTFFLRLRENPQFARPAPSA